MNVTGGYSAGLDRRSERIAELRDMGILTEEEFLVEKTPIMGSRAQMRSSQEAPMHDENELEKSQASDSMNSFRAGSTLQRFNDDSEADAVPEYSFLAMATSNSDAGSQSSSGTMTTLPVGAGLSQILDGTTGGQEEQIGSYRIISELGVGGMGVVYRARHVGRPGHSSKVEMWRSRLCVQICSRPSVSLTIYAGSFPRKAD